MGDNMVDIVKIINIIFPLITYIIVLIVGGSCYVSGHIHGYTMDLIAGLLFLLFGVIGIGSLIIAYLN